MRARWNAQEKKKRLQRLTEASGAGDEIRTRDPLLGKQLRYHCATPAWYRQYRPRECALSRRGEPDNRRYPLDKEVATSYTSLCAEA